MLFKLEKLVFLALIFSIPFQKRTFLFSPTEFFEWNSGFFYFTDFLVAALAVVFVLSFLPDVPFLRKQESRTFGPVFLLLIFLGLAFISLTQADLISVGVYRFIKLAEFIFLFLYVGARARAIGIKPILQAFVASGVFQAIIAILQFANQGSLGLEIFHESTIVTGMKGVAQISAHGLDMIRAYGTFPSPNVLAGFLGICLLFLFYLFIKHGTDTERYAEQARNIRRILLGVAIFILSFGLILTFSRGVIIFFMLTVALFFAGLFLLKQFKKYKKPAIYLLMLIAVCWLLIASLAWPEFSSRFLGSSIDEPAIQERLFFNEVGLNTIGQSYSHMLFGIGIGNFVNNFMRAMPGLPDYLYQPAHNIFILIASETGTLGLFAFILFIAFLIEKSAKKVFSGNIENYALLCVACFMFLIAMYDHYFWTIQQGSLIFWIALGLLVSDNRQV